MFKLSPASPVQARNQTTIAESAHHYLEQVKQLNPQAEGAAPILSHERAAELIADADRAKLERALARNQALMQVRIDDAQRARQVGDALLSWTEHKNADKVQQEATPAPEWVSRRVVVARYGDRFPTIEAWLRDAPRTVKAVPEAPQFMRKAGSQWEYELQGLEAFFTKRGMLGRGAVVPDLRLAATRRHRCV